MSKSQEAMVFSGHQKLTSAMKLRPESVGRLQITDNREPSEVKRLLVGGWNYVCHPYTGFYIEIFLWGG